MIELPFSVVSQAENIRTPDCLVLLKRIVPDSPPPPLPFLFSTSNFYCLRANYHLMSLPPLRSQGLNGDLQVGAEVGPAHIWNRNRSKRWGLV